MSERCVAGTSSSFRNYLQSRQYKNYDCQESFLLLPSLLPSLFSPVWFLGSWESKIPSFGVVPVKMAKSSGATFSKIQVDVASKCCQVVKNDRILADEWPFQHFLAILAHFMPTSTRIFENGTARFRCLSGVSRALLFPSETISKVGNIKIMSARSPFFFSPLSPPFSFLSRVVSRLMGVKNAQFRCRSGENGQILRSHLFKNPGRIVASKCCQVVKNDRILADQWPFQHFLAILAHFMPTIVASKCCQVVKNDRILADEWPFQHFLAILAHFIPTSTRIFENGTARFRCLSGVSRALRLRSETISKVGNIKIMSARSPFFFSRLSSLLFSLPCGF